MMENQHAQQNMNKLVLFHNVGRVDLKSQIGMEGVLEMTDGRGQIVK